jgi:hypothetical protein
MAVSATLDFPRQSGLSLPGEALTRRAVTVITAVISSLSPRVFNV